MTNSHRVSPQSMNGHAYESALVAGEALIDIVERRTHTIGEHVGGSPLNVAVGLGRLGRRVELLTSIGDDERGRTILDHLRANNVILVEGSISATRTATAHAHLDEHGSASYRFDMEWRPPQTTTTPPLVLHYGSIASVLEPGCDTVARMIDRCAGAATITFDPNVRPKLIEDGGTARTRIEAAVARADVVKASDEDLQWFDSATPLRDIAARWLSMGPAFVAVTLGARGAFAVCRAGMVRVHAHPTVVVDTVGAGDAFMAGLIDSLWTAGLLGARKRNLLRAISMSTLRAALEVASLSSALTVTRAGAEPPDRKTRDAALRRVLGSE